MCGRFTLTSPGELVAEAFGIDEPPQLTPRYNIAPTQPVAVVRGAGPGGARSLSFLRWGLVPTWAKGPRGRSLIINARAESLTEKPSFREPFESRRCLVPADGFYEWKEVPGARAKQPFLLRMADGRPFAFAGLWERPHPGDAESPGTCLVLTTEPNALVREIHDRMPLILAPQDYAAWLDPDVGGARRLSSLLRPFPAEAMTAVRVGLAVNNANNDTPDCLQPA